MTIRSCLEKWASETPDKTALRFYGSDKAWHTNTWAEFLSIVRKLGNVYGMRFSLSPRDENVAIILPNSPAWIEVYLAQSGAGVSVVPIDPKLHNDEVAYILENSGAVVVTIDKAHLPMMTEIAPRLPNLRAVVIVGGGSPTYAAIGSIPVYDFDSLLKESVPSDWYDSHVAQPQDVASVIYTSGTTGKPKGAMLTHDNFVQDIDGGLSVFGTRVDETDVVLVVLPLFHAFSFCTNFVMSMYRGIEMDFNRSLYTVGEDMKICRPTIFLTVPLMAEKMFSKINDKLQASRAARLLLSVGLGRIVGNKIRQGLGGRLRFMVVGGAPCPRHVLEGYKRLGIPLIEGYGLTECAPVVSVAGVGVAKIGTIGKKLSNVEVRLADKNEQGIGELQVKGPCTMKGYWKNPEATAETYDGEWLKTGDLASIDEQGFITIRGRKKALIVNREGKNIYPEEVENRIATDALVADCVVVGYTTGGLPGEKVGCIVHPDDDALAALGDAVPKDPDAFKAFITDRIQDRCKDLADYKRVRKVAVSLVPLQRTSIQKVRRVAYQGTLNE